MRTFEDRPRGAALFTTLLMVVVTMLILGAALSLLSGGQLMRVSLEADQQAQAAAQSGLDYARSRLQENPNWRGDGDAVMVNEPGSVWIREERGNVVGILWPDRGAPTVFRFRFNHQNGDSEPRDGFGGDPPASMRVPSPYVSVNSLNRPVATGVYRALDSGGAFSVTASSPTPLAVPRYSAILYVEGLAGDALVGLEPSDIGSIDSRSGLARRTIESIISRELSQMGDSVLYAADDVEVKVQGEFIVDSKSDRVPPRMRTLEDFTLQSPGGVDPLGMEDGEVYVAPVDGQFLINGSHSTDPVATQEDSSDSFLRIGWDQIEKAGPGAASIPAGTYVWRDFPPRLDYYAQEYDPAHPPTGSPTSTYIAGSSLDGGAGAITLNPLLLKMTINGDVRVTPAGGATGLAVIPEDGLLSALGYRPTTEMLQGSSGRAPILSAEGDIQLEGTFLGQGAVTADGDIRFQGSSLFEASSDMKVAVYAKGDIELESVPSEIVQVLGGGSGGPSPPYIGGGGDDEEEDEGDEEEGDEGTSPGADEAPELPDWLGEGASRFGTLSAGDVAFAGVLFSQGDFRANLSENLFLRGALVAYGGSPELGENPQANGRGGIEIGARNAELIYDSEYLMNLIDRTAPTRLEVRSWRKL